MIKAADKSVLDLGDEASESVEVEAVVLEIFEVEPVQSDPIGAVALESFGVQVV